MGNLYWTEEATEKGRLVRSPQGSKVTGEDVLNIFGWGSKCNVWANPDDLSELEEFSGLSPEETSERIGFLAWDAAASRRHEPKEILIRGRKYYSVCGYKELLPHLHNFTNSSKIIKEFEEQLVDELVFHLFGAMGYSTRDMGGPSMMEIIGYTIRFASLPVTPKDNAATEEDKPAYPTNRVARSRIYGAVLVPWDILEQEWEEIVRWNKDDGKYEKTGKMRLVKGAKKASPLEIFLDPKQDPWPIRKSTPPPPEMPKFDRRQRRKIAALEEPVGQFGLSPELTRQEQLKVYSIGELEKDPNLPISDPRATLAAKLLKWRSKCPREEITRSLKGGPHGEVVFVPEDPQRGIPAGGMYFVSTVTDIKTSVHPDPEFLHYDREHDDTIEMAVRALFTETLMQWEVITPLPDDPLFGDDGLGLMGEPFTYSDVQDVYRHPDGHVWRPNEDSKYDVLEEEHQIYKMPPTNDLLSLTLPENGGDLGYLKTPFIEGARYSRGKSMNSWIITVGIEARKLEEAEETEFSDPGYQTTPPNSKFDWLPWLNQQPQIVRRMKMSTLWVPFRGRHARKIPLPYLEVKDVYYYVYESEHDYFELLYDKHRQSRERNKASIALYESMSPPRSHDYRVCEFKFAPIPFSGKAAVLVGVRKDWVDRQPIKQGGKKSVLPQPVAKPRAKGVRPFPNWTMMLPPFPTWHDSNRETYYSINEAEDWQQWMDPETGKLDMAAAEETLASDLFQDLCSYFGKIGTPNSRVSPVEYYKYFQNRTLPQIEVQTYLPPKPFSAPRAIIGVSETLLQGLPNKDRVPTWDEVAQYNRDFMERESYLVLKVPTIHAESHHKFSSRMKVAAGALAEQAKKVGRSKSPQGYSAKELRRAANKINWFLNDFHNMVLVPNGVNPDASSKYANDNLRDEWACEYYIYLDPTDYSVVDVFAYGGTRLTKGISQFKKKWSQPRNIGMQFVYWAGMTYIKTNEGRNSEVGFFDMMKILTDPLGSLGDWLSGVPDIPGLPEGMTGQLMANAASNIKNIPPKPAGFTDFETAQLEEEAAAFAQQEAAKRIEMYGDDWNSDTSNPAATYEDPDDWTDGLSSAGCGQDLFVGILSKVNLPNLIIMYLKCLGLEMPIDPRCLFNFPFPLLDLNINVPKVKIPDVTLGDMLEVIRKMIYELLCALIIELLLTLVKTILEAVLQLGGCGGANEPPPDPPEPDANFDFGPFKPKDLIEDAMDKEIGPTDGPDPLDDELDPDKDADGFANKMFAECQVGLLKSDYGPRRTALTYFEDVSKILTGKEFCALVYGDAGPGVIDRVIKFTKVEYPTLYTKMPARNTGAGNPPEGSYIGWPREPGVPELYRNFFMCLGALLKPQVNEICNPDALRQKYGQPKPGTALDDKCEVPISMEDLNNKIQSVWRDRGLDEDEIEELQKRADDEIERLLIENDKIQAAIADFMDVTIPEITAPVVSSINMKAFDEIFKPCVASMRTGAHRIQTDSWAAERDLTVMVNYIANAKNLTVIDYTRHYHVWRLKYGWLWVKRRKYYRWWQLAPDLMKTGMMGLMNPDPDSASQPTDFPTCKADPILLDDKWKVKKQVFAWPWLWKPIQDAIHWFTGPHFQMVIPDKIRSQYKQVSLPWGPHKDEVQDLKVWHDPFSLIDFSDDMTGDWSVPRWYTDQGNLRFLQEYAQDNGLLANTVPMFQHGRVADDGISEKLVIGNGKLFFSMTLDKNGDNFIYDLYDTEGTRMDSPVTIDLSSTRTDMEQQPPQEVPLFPWWENRQVKSSDGWIQRDEFMARFIPEDHPLNSVSNSDHLFMGLFDKMHTDYYKMEVTRSIIMPLRRSPMEHYWLEEWFTASNWDELQNMEGMMLVRNKMFDPDDPYIKMGDIRQKAKEIMEGNEP